MLLGQQCWHHVPRKKGREKKSNNGEHQEWHHHGHKRFCVTWRWSWDRREPSAWRWMLPDEEQAKESTTTVRHLAGWEVWKVDNAAAAAFCWKEDWVTKWDNWEGTGKMGADYSRIRGTLGMGQEKWAPTTAGHRDFGFWDRAWPHGCAT